MQKYRTNIESCPEGFHAVNYINSWAQAYRLCKESNSSTNCYQSLATEYTPRYDGAGRDRRQTDTSGLLPCNDRASPSACCSSCWSLFGSVDCSWEGRSIAHTEAILTQDKHNHAFGRAALLLMLLLTRKSQTEEHKLLENARSSFS